MAGICHYIGSNGYSVIEHYHKGKSRCMPVHRLVCIAENGIDSVKGNHVHHKNRHKLDNRRENLEPLTPSEHTKVHYEDCHDVGPYFKEEVLREKYIDEKMSMEQIAAEYDIDGRTVAHHIHKHGIEARSGTEQRFKLWKSGDYTDEETLSRMYLDEEMTTYEIADELNVSASIVSLYMEKHGIDRRDRGMTEAREKRYRDKSKLRELYVEKDLPQSEVAERLGCDQATVCRWLDKHNIT